MYKLFLCLRYLIRRRIALVAIVGMALCVLMVVIVGCVMNGFLDFVQGGVRGMMGDVTIDSPVGMQYYDEFIATLEDDPAIERATPVIYTVGLLRLRSNFTEMVRVVGLRLPEAAEVTSFAEQIYPDSMAKKPSFKLTDDLAAPLLEQNGDVEQLLKTYLERRQQSDDELLTLDDENTDGSHDKEITELQNYILQLDKAIAQIRQQHLYMPELPGIILGVDLPYTKRNEATGEYQRFLTVGGAEKAMLTMLPLGRGNLDSMTQPVKRSFTIVADQRFGVMLVDSSHVYVDFDELARLIESEGRCDQLQIKLTAEAAAPANIVQTREHIEELWESFAIAKGIFSETTTVKTWREKQASYIDAVEKQRDLMVIILGVISLVAVVLVFAIFYMMIVQKIRDIGIIKSIGASDAGVAQIFLMYGAAIGLVGSILGAIGGVLFVQHINEIHDWIARAFNWRMFNRQAYMFDRIPDQVDYHLVVVVMIGTIIAGLLGALLPAMQAARMQPVESLRHE